jgi:hypothetical protein
VVSSNVRHIAFHNSSAVFGTNAFLISTCIIIDTLWYGRRLFWGPWPDPTRGAPVRGVVDRRADAFS